MRRLLVILFLFSAGCTSRAPSVFTIVPSSVDARPAIIFVPGFYGSALKDRKTGRRVFLTGMEALFGSASLSLFQSELATPPGPELDVEGLLGTVPVIPGLYDVDVYGPFLRRLRELYPQKQVLPLAYDWREDPQLAVKRLDEVVQLLRSRGCHDIVLMGHSLGGQIAAYYLAYGAQPAESATLSWSGAKVLQKTVLFGAPFNGSMIAFRSFEKGSGLPRSERLLPADTMSSFPSMYALLPTLAQLFDPSGKELSVDLFDAEVWKKFHFGLLRRANLSSTTLESRAHFTREWLSKSKTWIERLQMGHTSGWQLPKNFEVMNVIGAGRPTLNHGYLTGDGKLYFDPKDVTAAGLKTDPLFSDGDETVTFASAAVPAALEPVTKTVRSDFTHDQLFLDPQVEREYKAFLTPKD